MSEIERYADYLHKARIPIRLSCRTESGWPFVLSLWYLYRDGMLYCATVEDARVVKYLENEPRCGYEIAADLPPYCGVRGQARAKIDPDQGPEILEALLYRYLGGLENPLAEALLYRYLGGLENPLAENLLKDVDREVALVLDPINCFQWDFSQRMTSVVPDMLKLVEKGCP